MVVGTVLITGGIGYIGSFISLVFLEHDYDVIITDVSNEVANVVLSRIELICGRRPCFHQLDITDETALDGVFRKHPAISSVIHLAALKAVRESWHAPLEYYRVNVGGTIALLRSMQRNNVTYLVFSSSATIYGDNACLHGTNSISENCSAEPSNPYGRTKAIAEELIVDHIESQRRKLMCAGQLFDHCNGAILRYFNPCGAHPTGLMGEDPRGASNTLFSTLGRIAAGENNKLLVFGDDYATRDGTAVRDYVHVIDVAKGHLLALEYLQKEGPGVKTWNLGSGSDITVYEVIDAFSKATGHKPRCEVVPRRPGDVVNLTADPTLAKKDLGWEAEYTLQDICESAWLWVGKNPKGYRHDFCQA